ncbi:hypothetical protein D1AOALGA4SA_3920 [Olavius algarvensis Delta 1 endosymbiont]|nr:hypothetical protein D1AOALGA4SA_3920 [Olavius algarvensis Delta 1 endosymbiont]
MRRIFQIKYFRHQDTKARSQTNSNFFSLCLGAFVANLSSLSGLGLRKPKALNKQD